MNEILKNIILAFFGMVGYYLLALKPDVYLKIIGLLLVLGIMSIVLIQSEKNEMTSPKTKKNIRIAMILNVVNLIFVCINFWNK